MTILLIILAFTSVFFGYFCIKFALALLRVQDAIEKSLDAIDLKYNRISEILNLPVFYDSPEIKRIVQEIYEIREVIIYIANQLANSTKKNKLENNEEENLNNTESE